MDMRLLSVTHVRVLALIFLLAIGIEDAHSDQSSLATSVPETANQYVIQVGAFADPANAERLGEELEKSGVPTVSRSSRSDEGKPLTIVLAGPFASEDEAISAKTNLEQQGIAGFMRQERVLAQTAPVPKRQNVPLAGNPKPSLAQEQSTLIAQAEGKLFEVPPVMERPLGIDEGPRVRVRRFDLEGAVDRDKQDIRLGDIRTLLDKHVLAQPDDGYTINQLQAVADEVSVYYRERGFFIAQAIVPAQDVVDGVVKLRVLEGTLGQVRVEGNSLYKAAVVERPFSKLRGRPVTQNGIEQALLDTQDFPGLTVFGTFTQGQELGSTDLVVRVQEEDRFDITPSVDNYGSEFTGEYRAMVDFAVNNLFGVADRVSGYILQTFEPDNGTYGGVNAQVPFGRNAIGLGASYNQFDVGGLSGVTDFRIKGEVQRADIYWDRSFANGRFFGANARLGVATKKATTKAPGIDSAQEIVFSEDKLAVTSLSFDFFAAGRKGRSFSVGSVIIDIGMPNMLGSMDGSGNGNSSRRGGDGELAGGSFEKYGFKFEHLRRLGESTSLLLRLDAQYTDDILVALEQYAIGGPANVRAYPVAEALTDSGASASLEWIVNAPGFADKPTKGGRTWGEIFQVSLYADYAYGKTNNPGSIEEPTVDYSGYGLGLQFNLPRKFYTRFDVASPIGSRTASNSRDPQYFFRMSFTY